MQDAQPAPEAKTSIPAFLPALLAGLVFVGFFVGLVLYYPVGVDWNTYHMTADTWLHPYEVDAFEGIPLVMLALPHAFLNLELGNAINLSMHIVVLGAIIRVYGGDRTAFLLTFTSPLFLDLGAHQQHRLDSGGGLPPAADVGPAFSDRQAAGFGRGGAHLVEAQRLQPSYSDSERAAGADLVCGVGLLADADTR